MVEVGALEATVAPGRESSCTEARGLRAGQGAQRALAVLMLLSLAGCSAKKRDFGADGGAAAAIGGMSAGADGAGEAPANGGASAGGMTAAEGGDATAPGSGGDGTTAGAGMGGDTGSAGGMGGVDGGEPGDGTAIGVLNEPCSLEGAYACAGHAKKGQLVCSNGVWTTNGACDGNSNCDTSPGSSAGSCQPIVPECQGLKPGDLVCKGQDIEQCGVDLVTALVGETCSNQACVDAACQGACTPKSARCAEDVNGVQICDDSGSWGAAVECAASGQSCSNGACVTCAAATANCDSNPNDCETNLNSTSTCGTTCANAVACSSAHGTPSCTKGVCGISCAAGYADCGGSNDGCETNLASTSTCGTTCGNAKVCSGAHGTASCTNGVCGTSSCASGYADCGGTNDGCETNLTSTTTCGTTCGNVKACSNASGTASCAGGVCGTSSCTSGYADCGGTNNGCETNLTSTTTCGTTCANVSACAPQNAAAAKCTSGACGYTACSAGYGDCDSSTANGCETNLNATASCGTTCGNKVACTNTNASGSTCSSGKCGFTCSTNYADCDGAGTNGCEVDLKAATTCGKSCAAVVACDALSAGTCVNGGCSDFWAGWPMPNSSVDINDGAPNPGSYTVNVDGTVTDNVTGLVWQQTPPSVQYNAANAALYCTSLSLAGHSDWRLPSLIELFTLSDFTGFTPAWNPVFGSTPSGPSWSSTPVAGTDLQWHVHFGDGAYQQSIKTGTKNVRCVR